MGGPGALLTCSCPPGEPLPAHQDPGRLLLLRVGAAGGARGPRTLLRGDGRRHDRGHLVSGAEPGAVPVPSATTAWGLHLTLLCPSPGLAHLWCHHDLGGCTQPWCWHVPSATTTLRGCVWHWCVPGATATWRGCDFPSSGKSQVPPQLEGRVPFLVLAHPQYSSVWVPVLGGAMGCLGAPWCLGCL